MAAQLKLLEETKQDLPPRDPAHLSFSLLEIGTAGNVAVVPESEESPNLRLSTVPNGLPPVLPDVKEELEKYLTCPASLLVSQKFWPRQPCVENLYHMDSCPVQSTLQVKRKPTTGELLGYEEVDVVDTGISAKNSTSLARPPGPLSEAVRGSSTNFPFWPGGMDEPSLDVITKSLESATVDLEHDLETVPPGFECGMSFEEEKDEKEEAVPIETKTGTVLTLNDIVGDFDDLDLMGDDEEENDEQRREDDMDESAQIPRSESLEDMLIKNEEEKAAEDTPVKVARPVEEQWAVNVDISTPVSDFYKRIPDPAYRWPFELDVFQKQAILRLENHESVFVAAHTSAGKTVVAEYAIALAAKHMTRTVYTSPIKALSNQKFRDFKTTFSDVGLLTGDVQIHQEASCLIMTTEILRSMLYNGSDVIRDLEWVIFDEVHYINDSERGVVWEEVLIMLPDHVNLILLSATVPNTLEFAEWIGRTKRKKIYVISTLKRPVPLEHYLYTGNSNKTSNEKFLIVDSTRNFMTKGYYKAVDAKKERASKHSTSYGAKGVRQGNPQQDKNVWLSIVGMLKKSDGLPVVAFTFSKKKCDSNASQLTTLDLTTSIEKSEIHVFFQKCVQRLKDNDRKLPQVLHMKELLKRGVGVHHSGILPILKEVIEMLFQRGLVKLLFATETFAMGVNMPARTVVFDSIRKHDGMAFRDLLPGEYIQMAGRAGRRGLDTTGTVFILCKGDVPEMADLHKMMLGKPTKLESQFRLTYSMILNLLRVEALRVEDMMKRSFSEFHTQKDRKVRQRSLEEMSKKLKTMKDVDCTKCKADLEEYYLRCKEIQDLRTSLQKIVITHPQAVKALSQGRIVIINNSKHKSALAVVLSVSSSSSAERTFKVLVLTEKSPDSNSVQNSVSKDNTVTDCDVLPITANSTKLFQPEGAGDHTVEEITGDDMGGITTRVLKVAADNIIADYKKRQQLRFRNDPPGQSCSVATQELLRITHANPDGLETLDPIADLHIRDIDLVERFKQKQFLEKTIENFTCVNCPHFQKHFQEMHEIMKVKGEFQRLKYLLSDQSLQLLPEYQLRISVLRELRYIDGTNTVQLKGRVACEISNHELIITELVFENVLTSLDPTEIAALLSCMVFQEKRCSEPKLTETLEQGKQRIIDVATRIGQLQVHSGLKIPVGDYVEQFRFGLTEVVYEWARKMPFSEITDLTDVSEGIIVRTIQRLDEVCRDVRNAARIIGDPVLYKKMEDASSAIKRDIVFAASLYTQ
ncbi:superkiller complex protein 2-like [Ptychodera flava]|uniref:superkiller complex protein 2-like n=1 Tax=Ptychodera flava TaxID=63121 RepID=UPI00396A40C7